MKSVASGATNSARPAVEFVVGDRTGDAVLLPVGSAPSDATADDEAAVGVANAVADAV